MRTRTHTHTHTCARRHIYARITYTYTHIYAHATYTQCTQHTRNIHSTHTPTGLLTGRHSSQRFKNDEGMQLLQPYSSKHRIEGANRQESREQPPCFTSRHQPSFSFASIDAQQQQQQLQQRHIESPFTCKNFWRQDGFDGPFLRDQKEGLAAAAGIGERSSKPLLAFILRLLASAASGNGV